jgi:hypothetical protein
MDLCTTVAELWRKFQNSKIIRNPKEKLILEKQNTKYTHCGPLTIAITMDILCNHRKISGCIVGALHT